MQVLIEKPKGRIGAPPSTTPIEKRFWSRVDKRDQEDCWLWTGGKGGSSHGLAYGRLNCTKADRESGLGSAIYAHRLSWEIHHGPIPEGMQVCHSCDTPLCVNPSHFFLGTQSENDADRDRKGRTAKGEQVGNHRLTESDVRQMRGSRAAGETVTNLATRFGVSIATASMAVNGRTWANL